jgi:hypothetical protein
VDSAACACGWNGLSIRALTRHLGGNQIHHLATADLNAFLSRNLRLERVDHVALGNLLREVDKFGDLDAACITSRDSPAQIRGYLRGLRDGKRPRKRGRPKHKPHYRRPITDYRIDACFQPIELLPVTSPGIIIPAQPKSLTTTAGYSSACTPEINTSITIRPNPPEQPDEPNAGSPDDDAANLTDDCLTNIR